MTSSAKALPTQKGIDRRSSHLRAWLWAAVILAGFALLPRLASFPSAMIGQPAPDFVLPVVLNGQVGEKV